MSELARIRKVFVTASINEPGQPNPPRGAGNWRQYRKDQAHAEFNAMIAAERADAVRAYKKDMEL